MKTTNKKLFILMIIILHSCKYDSQCFLIETTTKIVYNKDVVDTDIYKDYVKESSYSTCALARIEEKEILAMSGVETIKDYRRVVTIHTTVTRKKN